MKIVLVTWLDACGETEHVPPELADKLSPIKRQNIGFLIERNDRWAKICFGTLENLYKDETAYDMLMVIPDGMIESIEELTIKEEE